jgi:hypothetical protein
MAAGPWLTAWRETKNYLFFAGGVSSFLLFTELRENYRESSGISPIHGTSRAVV